MEIKEIIRYTIPLYGNKHIFPYGKILVTDGKTEKIVRFEDYSFCFNRKRCYIRNTGTLYSPQFEIK